MKAGKIRIKKGKPRRTGSTALVRTTGISLGCHLSMSTHKTVCNLLGKLLTIRGNAVQLCVSSPQSWANAVEIKEADAKEAQNMIERFNLAVFVHGKYIYNFCRSWSKAESCLISELKQCHRIGARGVVIHQGKNCGKGKEALTREQAKRKFVDNVTSVAEKFYRLFPDSGVKIILENSARQGTELGYSLDELAEIYQLIPDRLKCRFQFCIDTCHAFVAGEIDFRLPEVVDDWFKRFDRLIGLGKLALIHLNDSKIDWNGRADRHENLFAGYIGESFKESFSVLEGLARRGIPLVTETPTTDRLTELNQLKLLLNVHSPVRSNSD